jgi:hypothetical protein
MLGARLRGRKPVRRLQQLAQTALVVGASHLILDHSHHSPASQARPLLFPGFGDQEEPIAMDCQLRAVVIVDNEHAALLDHLGLLRRYNEHIVRKSSVRRENPVLFLIGHRQFLPVPF